MAELNISNEDAVPGGIADEVSAVLGFVALVLEWYEDDRDIAPGQEEMTGLSIILSACISSLRRIR